MMQGTLFLTLVIIHCSQASSVPLLTWTTSDNQEKLPTIIAGQTKDLSKVYSDYLTPMIQNKAVVLLFIQDELSADDFTKYSTSFPHLQKILQNEKYLLFPSVSKKEDAITQLTSPSQGNIEHVDSGGLTGWKFQLQSEAAPTKFVVFNLEPVSGSHSKGKGEILERNDLLMHRIVKSVHETVKDICVVYTADEPAPMITDMLLNEDMADNGLASRHILEATTKAPTVAPPQKASFFNSTSVMMYVKGIQLTHKKESTEMLIPNATWTTGVWPGSNCSISISTLNTIGNYSNVTIAMTFIQNKHEWYCDELLFSGKYDGSSFNSRLPCGRPVNGTRFTSVYDTIHAPSGKSYACYKLTFAEHVNSKAGNYSDAVIFDGMQVQTTCGGMGLAQFRTAYDCVGFFTIEALTAIFVTLILMIGLYGGVMMMMAIQVQDRLDDPKGKTITVVTASHD